MENQFSPIEFQSELIEPIIVNRSSQSAVHQNYRMSDTVIVLEAWNPLHLVVIHDHFDCLEILLKVGKIFVDSRSIVNRKTALILASELCQFNVVKLLLESGADPNAQDTSGKSPLFYASRRGN